MGKLDGKVAIVTGGTSGIGEATARLFHEKGATVIITGRNESAGIDVANSISYKTVGRCSFLHCDISDNDQVSSLVRTVFFMKQRIDILINNAGVFSNDWEECFNINVSGYGRMVKECLPYLKKSHGVILNNASIAGLHSYNVGHSYAYSASKAAVIKMTQMMAKNYAKDGIRVNCISPGIIETPIFKEADMSGYLERIPMGRIGSAEDVARAALFLCSDDSSYITGHNLIVDGGVSI